MTVKIWLRLGHGHGQTIKGQSRQGLDGLWEGDGGCGRGNITLFGPLLVACVCNFKGGVGTSASVTKLYYSSDQAGFPGSLPGQQVVTSSVRCRPFFCYPCLCHLKIRLLDCTLHGATLYIYLETESGANSRSLFIKFCPSSCSVNTLY